MLERNVLKKIIIVLLIILMIPIFIYIILDGKNLYVDMYNFRQLEKVKIILKDLKRENKQFNNLNEFNKIYNTDIKPTKNCYDVSNYNGIEQYIFGFKLESYIYIFIYGDKFYAYPTYDIPYQNVCIGGEGGGCFDGNRKSFERTISNPCKD